MSIGLETIPNSAHRELRRKYRQFLAGAILMALVSHSLIAVLSPTRSPMPYRIDRESPIFVVEIAAPEYHIPAPPKQLPPPDIPMEDIEPVDVELPPLADDAARDIRTDFAPPIKLGSLGPKPQFTIAPEQRPEVLDQEPPQYPWLAQQAEAEGTVELLVSIGPDGRVVDAKVIHSSAIESLESAALAAIYKWVFQPARQGGVPVAVQIKVPFQFRLR